MEKQYVNKICILMLKINIIEMLKWVKIPGFLKLDAASLQMPQILKGSMIQHKLYVILMTTLMKLTCAIC